MWGIVGSAEPSVSHENVWAGGIVEEGIVDYKLRP